MTWGSSNWKLLKKIGDLLFRKMTGAVDIRNPAPADR